MIVRVVYDLLKKKVIRISACLKQYIPASIGSFHHGGGLSLRSSGCRTPCLPVFSKAFPLLPSARGAFPRIRPRRSTGGSLLLGGVGGWHIHPSTHPSTHASTHPSIVSTVSIHLLIQLSQFLRIRRSWFLHKIGGKKPPNPPPAHQFQSWTLDS